MSEPVSSLASRPVTWRAPDREDLPAWIELVHAQQRADGHAELVTLEELTAAYDSGTWAPRADARLAQDGTGALVADGVVATQGPGREAVRVFCAGGVHPDWRGRGVGRELLGWQVARGRERYAALDADVPGLLEVACPDGHPAGRLYARFGFAPVRYWSHMAHDLSGLPAAAPARAADLRVAGYREELSERVRRAHNEAFADHWGSVERDKASWQEYIVGHPCFRPELSFVVLDGVPKDPTVAAYLMAYHAEPTGPGEPPMGYIGQVGTRRSWRGRGLASALVGAALVAMKGAGYGRATLTVDTGGATGAQALYERLGFVTQLRRVTWQRPVAAGPAAVPG